MRVQLRPSTVDHWLDAATVYTVLCVYSDEDGVGFRLLGTAEPHTPAIHPAGNFDVVDSKVSPRWVCRLLRGGRTVWFEPQAWSSEGFWDRYFNYEPESRRLFQEEVRLLAAEP